MTMLREPSVRPSHALSPLRMRIFAIGMLALYVLLSGAEHSHAQQPAAVDTSRRELVVGIKQTPPFAIHAADDEWQGISVDLWRHAASKLKLRYRFVEEPSIGSLIDGVANGKYDVAIGALTVTGARARVMDFTSPFYSTGLGIAVPASGMLNWMPVIQSFTNLGFLQAVTALLLLALFVGFLIWFLERRHNEEFGGDIKKGLSSSIWWSTAAMTRRGNVDYSPRTVAGRIVASIWTVMSIVAIAVFTAAVTSSLTVRHLQGSVHSVNDLQSARVGIVKDTSTLEALKQLKISFHTYETPQQGLQALRAHKIDAFVYDKPLLAWLIQQEFSATLEMLDTTFEPQHYAFAIANNSKLRAPLNIAILDATQSTWWKDVIARYLGSRIN